MGQDSDCGVQGAILNQMLIVVVGLLRPRHLKQLEAGHVSKRELHAEEQLVERVLGMSSELQGG